MAPGMKNILIIDDHQLFADGLQLLLSQLLSGVDVSTHNNAQQVLEEGERVSSASLVIVDLHMPKFSGFSFLQAVQQQHPAPPVLVISGVESRADIERALALGAAGFIPKEAPSNEMLEGVSKVLAGERYLPTRWAGKIDWPMGVKAGTEKIDQDIIGPRQIQVLELLEDGLQNKQIALVLGVSVSTVKSHTQLLYRKLQVTNRTACIKAATDLGLLKHSRTKH